MNAKLVTSLGMAVMVGLSSAVTGCEGGSPPGVRQVTNCKRWKDGVCQELNHAKKRGNSKDKDGNKMTRNSDGCRERHDC